jgi:Zn-dependent protease with chaperone function
MRLSCPNPAKLVSGHEAVLTAAALYAASLAVQLVCAYARALAAMPLLWLVLTLLGRSTAPMYTLALLAGFAPLALSVLTLAFPRGGLWWQAQSGGRAPSGRERLIYEDALSVIREADASVRAPRRWFVLDEPQPAGAAYGDAVMLSRGLLESGWLEPVLAHELGHVNSFDARLTAAVWRLRTPSVPSLRLPLRVAGALLSGEAGAWLMRVPWANFWRAREFAADAFAARLGQGEALAGFLESNALADDGPVPFAWLRDHSHPSTEHRIERLVEMTSEKEEHE